MYKTVTLNTRKMAIPHDDVCRW